MPSNLFPLLARTCLQSVSAAVPVVARCGAVVVVLWLVACVQGPQAAMAPVRNDALVSVSVGRTPVADVARCPDAWAARDVLLRVSQELQAHGMAMQATCHAASGGWVVQVHVTDGVKASKLVRGPLADGHEVDMGAATGSAWASTRGDSVSPDVTHNRQWLTSLMKRHQFAQLPDARGWHFAQQGAASARASVIDGIAR